MFAFAQEFRSGNGGTKSCLGEMAWTLRAAAAGDLDAQVAAGYAFMEARDFKRYLYWTKKAAASGSPNAMFNLGSSYHKGQHGVEQNLRVAIEYFIDAERLGYKDSLSEIGSCYIKLGDFVKARMWLDRAIELNKDKICLFPCGRIMMKMVWA